MVIIQSQLASQCQARSPSPLILGFWKTFLYNWSGALGGYTFVQIVVTHPASLHQFRSRLNPEGVPSKKDSVSQGMYCSLDLPAYLAHLFPIFLSWHFPASSLPLLLFFLILLLSLLPASCIVFSSALLFNITFLPSLSGFLAPAVERGYELSLPRVLHVHQNASFSTYSTVQYRKVPTYCTSRWCGRATTETFAERAL